MLTINDLSFSYEANTPYLLNNLNIHIKSGYYVSILGENGSAKSTLLKLILGFIKPNTGSIIVNTHNIGYVPQRMENFNSQFPITVKEVLHTHLKVLKLKDRTLINNCLATVNMVDYKDSLIGNLSGGQMQRVFIARAIMGSPKLLILDEPSTGVDMKSQEDIYRVIKSLNNDGVTVISVEHNLKAAIDNSTHILRLENGAGSLYPVEEYLNLINM